MSETLEGDWQPHRTVVLEFQDMAALKRWYDSEEYVAIKGIRLRAASASVMAVEGA